jgi:hypothetical protein
VLLFDWLKKLFITWAYIKRSLVIELDYIKRYFYTFSSSKSIQDTMSGRGKTAGSGKARAKAKTRSSRAGLQFPVVSFIL